MSRSPAEAKAGVLTEDLVLNCFLHPRVASVGEAANVLDFGVEERLRRGGAVRDGAPERLVYGAAEVVVRLLGRGIVGAGAADKGHGAPAEEREGDRRLG